jgi:hypothetical protein
MNTESSADSYQLVRVTFRTGAEKVLGTYADIEAALKTKRLYERRFSKGSKGMFTLELR